ncbi:type III secretion system translocon subunit SctE [Sansalvadorimonas sp. 2012CJ34-2]|uniref:Type III secretion system translocon subunit SctE n=1 Tax=Parendozoicomonas callyspongiae TaxID=2942213 RepID=A0ABT0PGR7_9GAMM|nr:type III secretion system translocon subunit SctE [Sansalvadorimonas sp. 2012CJ34-2]MCL6270564.1 type III secretion system translocon subunit SctE [Sansalvadorimonas sp. 2012CJ34-2]
MSGTGGIRVDHGGAVQNLTPSNSSGKAGQTQTAEHVGRGFSNKNSVSHQRNAKFKGDAAGRERSVRLPKPTVDPAKVTNPALQAQIAQGIDTTELVFTFEDILSELASSEEQDGADSDVSATGLFSSTRQKGGSRQGGGDQSGYQGGQQQVSFEQPAAGVTDEAQKLAAMEQEALHVFDKVLAIESAPPEVMEQLKASSAKLADAVLSGNIEDVARMLSEVQTKLQDTRIKFDEQAIRTSRLKRSQVSQQRIEKLTEALEKLKESKKAGTIGKIFGAIATAIMVVVAAVTIATGVGAKAGIMLIMAATIMVAMTISQNTGDWMTNLGGLIKDDKAQLVMGLAWAILAAALSLGSGFVAGKSKVVTDAATTTVQQTTNAATQAAQQGANAAAQGAQQSANTAAQTAQQSAAVVQETAKQAAKTATDVADDAVEQATKVAVKSAQESAKEAAKSTAEATKEATKETTKQLAEISKKEMYFRRAAHIGRFTQGASQAVEGSAQISSSASRYEGEMYQASATDDLAELTKLQLQMEDWMEAIGRALQEIQEGQQIASDMLSQAQQNKFTIARNI